MDTIGEDILEKSCIEVNSEIGPLKKVFVHTPGREVELMTPNNAAELLYNDIIYYKNIVAGHSQLKSVLSLVSQVYEVSDCLTDILEIPQARAKLLDQVLFHQDAKELKEELFSVSSSDLSAALITGVPLRRNTLERFLSTKTFSQSTTIFPSSC